MDGQQFHQYQYESPELIEHRIAMTYDVRNPSPGLWQTRKCIRLPY